MTDLALASDPTILATFDRLCAVVSERGRGLSFSDLSAAWALARGIGAEESDESRIESFRDRLGVDEEALR